MGAGKHGTQRVNPPGRVSIRRVPAHLVSDPPSGPPDAAEAQDAMIQSTKSNASEHGARMAQGCP